MTTPGLVEFFGGKHTLGEWNSFLADANLPDLGRFDETELKELSEFTKGRHSQEEWDAFFAYVALPPRKRLLSRIAGLLWDVLGFWENDGRKNGRA